MTNFTSPISTPATSAIRDDGQGVDANGGGGSAIDAALRVLTSAGIGFEVLFETDSTGLAA